MLPWVVSGKVYCFTAAHPGASKHFPVRIQNINQVRRLAALEGLKKITTAVLVGQVDPLAKIEVPAGVRRVSHEVRSSTCVFCYATGDGDSAASDSVLTVENGERGGADSKENSTTATAAAAEGPRIAYRQVTKILIFSSIAFVVFVPLRQTEKKKCISSCSSLTHPTSLIIASLF